jgi:small GTP-binding protein
MLTFKVAVIGPFKAGKTSIVKQLVKQRFSHDHIPTVGAEFLAANFQIDGQDVRLQIWDVTGYEKYRSLVRVYAVAALGGLVVFDSTDRNSFEGIPEFIQTLKAVAPDVVLFLIGNKTDLPNRVVTAEEARALALQYNMTYIETSATNNTNVVEMFKRVASALLEKRSRADPPSPHLDEPPLVDDHKVEKSTRDIFSLSLSGALGSGLRRLMQLVEWEEFTFVVNGCRIESNIAEVVVLSPSVFQSLMIDRTIRGKDAFFSSFQKIVTFCREFE